MGSVCQASSSTAIVLNKQTTSIKVHYWGPHPGMELGVPFYGRAIGIYLTLDQAGYKYEKCYAGDAMNRFAGPNPNFLLAAESDANQLKGYAPPLVEIDGNFMAQTPQILAVLGETFGLAGQTRKENMQVLHALGDVQDVFDLHNNFVTDVALKDKWFKYLENKLQRYKSEGNSWMGGTKGPSVADFHGVFTFCCIVGKSIDFSNYPNLTQWWKAIKAFPVVANMLGTCNETTNIKMVPV